MLYIVVAAVGLMFVFEGVMPFLAPDRWRKMILLVAARTNHMIRTIGLMSMLFGMILIVLAHYLFY